MFLNDKIVGNEKYYSIDRKLLKGKYAIIRQTSLK